MKVDSDTGRVRRAGPGQSYQLVSRFISRGFGGRRQQTDTEAPHRVPPGQHLVRDFPVLTAGPTPRTPLEQWSFTIEGLVRHPVTWTWDAFLALPAQPFVVDIHCVTSWSKPEDLIYGAELAQLGAAKTGLDVAYTSVSPVPHSSLSPFLIRDSSGRPLRIASAQSA